MPPNLRKTQPNLSKPSEGSSFSAGKQPSGSINPLQGLNITAERELGTVGGIKSTAKLTVGVDNLIGQQGVNVEIDATNRTLGVGAGIGSTRGKLGVNIGGKIGYDEEGNLSVKGAEAGINIAGFGGSASIDEDEGIRGSISVAGAKVEIGINPEGKKTLTLCYGVPGGELCVTFEPDPGVELPPGQPAPTPTPTPVTPPGLGLENPFPHVPPPNIDPDCRYWIKDYSYYKNNWDLATGTIKPSAGGNTETPDAYAEGATYLNADEIYPFPAISSYYINDYRVYDKNDPRINTVGFSSNCYYTFRMIGYINKSTVSYGRNTIGYHSNGLPIYGEWIELVSTNSVLKEICDKKPPINKLQLPNYPQHFKPMNDCCEMIKEIHKFLGIAKLKKNRFPVSNAFLVPGGTGADNCFDYYSIMQALFRMLANGLILNPKSKPLGTEWQNVNATAWASAMYEMMAESMSDGNSTQRFEVAAIMQLAQMMSTLAENGRKIEFVADAIGLEPTPVPEEIPICFTIYEGHKGFGKKEPKKIDTSKLKTDDDVEKVLGKMLNPSLIPITAWKFKPGQISINEALRNG